MHLKRLELLGFKSFANKTILELDRGITGLVGPNGTGKSNVVDAIRWALGEQSLRAVRSRKSEDVIFAGNTRRAPVGMAEVTLVLDNSDGALPLPFAEVSVTRRHYRSGEGEYLINRSRARLRDVVDLLSRVSLGQDAYAVVGQGAVDEVLLQRPEERRGLLEAAADISRHQAKMRESLDKLAETEVNLRRVEDICGELAPRIPKLRAQANRARRYEDVARRVRQMELWRYLLQIRHTREQAAAEKGLESQRAAVVAGAARAQAASREQVTRLREELRAEESALEAARERLSALRLARAKSEREAALLRERETAFRRQRAEAEEELARARKEGQELRTEVERMADLRSDLAAREEKLRAEMVPLEGDRRRLLAEQRILQSQLERVAADQQGAARRRSELQERLNALTREARRAETARAEGAEAAKETTGQVAKLEEQLSASQQELDRLRADLAGLEARQRDAQARQRAVGEQLAAARREERAAWERDSNLRNRVTALRSLKEENRGVSAGAKALLEARLPGIRGTLASLIQVPREYVIAVAAALGGAQGYVVAEGFREGLEGLRFLAKNSGKATIAPLRLEKREPPGKPVADFRSGQDGLLDGVAFRGVAADLVSCPPEALELCARYLGLSLVVEGMSDALELYRRLTALTDCHLPFQVVTMDGCLLRARGDLANAKNGEKDNSLVARETELLALSETVERAGAVLREARAEVVALEAAQAGHSREVSAAAAEASKLQAQVGKQNTAGAELTSQMAKAEAAIEWHRSRAATVERETVQTREASARTEKELAEAAGRETDAVGRAEQLRADLADQQSAVGEASSRLSRLQSEMASVQNRLREVVARTSAVAEAFGRAEARVQRQEERQAQFAESLAQLLQASQPGLAAFSPEELEAVEKRVGEASPQVAGLRDRFAAVEKELSDLTETLETAREELSETRARAQRSAAELAALVREAAREAGLFPPAPPTGDEEPGGTPDPDPDHRRIPEPRTQNSEPSFPPDPLGLAAQVVKQLGDLLIGAPVDDFPATLAGASEKAEALGRELRSLGTVNAEAPEEYRLVSERHAFLTAQMDDLRQAERTLRKAIDDLRQVMEGRFLETFELVSAEFARCFTTLFGGGSAKLALIRPDQPLEGGVEVLAVPPGRRGGTLLALSGGERALTAVALLFALMKVNPSPFCLLDEVDAALDESNVHRFCAMLRGLTGSTQFLTITHNRVTMEMADALYGVSMSSDLVSRVVSLRLASKESQA